PGRGRALRPYGSVAHANPARQLTFTQPPLTLLALWVILYSREQFVLPTDRGSYFSNTLHLSTRRSCSWQMNPVLP
ncbi:MAG: hypothetical protein WCD86_14110, partial [Ktedonobacteraceae bacterium]